MRGHSGQTTAEWLGVALVAGALGLGASASLGAAGAEIGRELSCVVDQLRGHGACTSPTGHQAEAGPMTKVRATTISREDAAGDGFLVPWQEIDGPDSVTDDDPYTYDLTSDTASELRPTIALRKCALAKQTAGCPAPPAAPTVTDGRDPAPATLTPAEAAAERAMLRNATWAQDYYYQRFGLSGWDGLGSGLAVTAHVDLGPGIIGQAASGTGQVAFADAAFAEGSEPARGTALHELTHQVTSSLVGTLQYDGASAVSAQEGSIEEGLAMMAEMEVYGEDWVRNLSRPLAAQPQSAYKCAPPDDPKTAEVEGYDPYDNAFLLASAYADIARGMGTVTLGAGVDGGDDLDPGWERAAEIRFRAMSTYLKPLLADGGLTFGDLRAAFVSAARDVGGDPTIVEKAFDKRGVTSATWKPPACTYPPAS